MDRIPDRSHQSPSASQPINNDQGKLGSKQVIQTDGTAYLEKNSVPNSATNSETNSGQPLNEREITSNALQIMVATGRQQQWGALASAISRHGNSLGNLTAAMDTLQQHDIKLPVQIQNKVGLHFAELAAVNAAASLQENLPADELQALGLLDQLVPHHNHHDSPIGTIVRLVVDEFIKKYQLNDANRKGIVQSMSAKVYSLTSERMTELEGLVIDATTDANIIKQIRHAQNERRIVESFWQDAAKS